MRRNLIMKQNRKMKQKEKKKEKTAEKWKSGWELLIYKKSQISGSDTMPCCVKESTES